MAGVNGSVLHWRSRCISGRSWSWGLLPIVGIVFVLPASASASTVTLSARPDPVLGDEIRYVAGSGERNQVVVRQLEDLLSPSGGTWMVTDLGAPISPGSWCSPIDAHTARCSRSPAFPGALGSPVTRYRVSLGDLDDRLEVASTAPGMQFPPALVADGGPGDDVIYGTDAPGDGTSLFNDPPFSDRLSGGGGRDALHGRGGSDYLSDDDRDGSNDGGPDRDIIDGGPGIDVVSYWQRTRPVVIDLADPNPDGERGERDVIMDVEGIVGGTGNDQLSGDGRPNQISGGAGADRLAGRDGNDQLTRGGRSISCGAGRDSVLGGYGPRGGAFFEMEYLRPGCETVEAQGIGSLPAYPAFVRSRAVGYEVRCPPAVDDEGDEMTAVCSGTVRFREEFAGGRLLARGTFIDLEEGGIVKARLTPLGRHFVTRHRGGRATMRLTGPQFGAGSRWTIRLVKAHSSAAILTSR